MGTKKDNYFQVMRAVAIIAVVLIHSFGIQIRNISLNHTMEIVLRQFINYAVPMFVFISGYFVNMDTGVGGGYSFILKRCKSLLTPYFIWSAIGIVMSRNFSIKHMIYILVTGQAIAPLYFILMLVQLVILTPLMVKALNDKRLIFLMLLITPIWLIGVYSYSFISNNFIGYPYNLLPFAPWFIFYFFGVLYKNSVKIGITVKNHIGLIFSGYVTGLFFSIFEGLSMYNANANWLPFSVSSIKISSFITSFFLICTLMCLKDMIQVKPNNPLVYIGNNSFGIFFIHMIVMQIVSSVGVFTNITNQIAFTILNATITICFSLLLIFLSKKVLGEKISRIYLGF